MRTIRDKNGRTLEINLTIGGVRRVKARCNADLLKPESGTENNLVFQLCTDDLLLAEVVATLAETRERTCDDIMDSLDGTSLREAQNALLDELVVFFQARNNEFRAVLVETQVTAITTAYQTEVETLRQNTTKYSTVSTPPLESSELIQNF